MKIIKQGQLPGERMYRYTCFTCKTEFEFAQKEAKQRSSHHPMEDDYLEINCPLCYVTCNVGLSKYVRS